MNEWKKKEKSIDLAKLYSNITTETIHTQYSSCYYDYDYYYCVLICYVLDSKASNNNNNKITNNNNSNKNILCNICRFIVDCIESILLLNHVARYRWYSVVHGNVWLMWLSTFTTWLCSSYDQVAGYYWKSMYVQICKCYFIQIEFLVN